MFRYVTLNSNSTIDKESANPFDGAIKIYVSEDKMSTYLYTPYLCWVEKVNDTYVIHIPDDAPRPTYEQRIEKFKEEIESIKEKNGSLSDELNSTKEQLKDSIKNSNALVTQLKSVQSQNMIFAQQLSMLNAQKQGNKDTENNQAQ